MRDFTINNRFSSACVQVRHQLHATFTLRFQTFWNFTHNRKAWRSGGERAPNPSMVDQIVWYSIVWYNLVWYTKWVITTKELHSSLWVVT